MDWKSVKFDWNRARAFLVTAEEGSLSAASRALGIAQPTLGRQVSALEEELGVALFERVGRGLELTPSGTELVEHVKAMGEAASKVSLMATGQSQTLEGNICISTSEVYAGHVMPQIIKALREAAPGITVELVASNELSDLKRREADIAIRTGESSQPDLIAKKVKVASFGLYAASAYLDKLGRPEEPEDLVNHEFIGFAYGPEFIDAIQQFFGVTLTHAHFPVLCYNHLVHWELVKAGLGVGVIGSAVGDRTPGVERLFPNRAPIPAPIWLVAHRELRTSRRVRFVFDFLADALKDAL